MFNKNSLIMIFLIILTMLFSSCGRQASKESGDISDTEYYYLTPSDCKSAEEYNPTEYSNFNNMWAAIVEFGEQIFVDSEEGLKPACFSREVAGEEEKYIAYSIKLHKIFDATTKKSGLPHDSVFYSNIYPGRMHTMLNEVADYYNKDHILSEYDDIILIRADSSREILIGEKYLVFLKYLEIYYPHFYFEYAEDSAVTWCPRDNFEGNPDIIRILDEKISLPEDFYDKTNKGNYVYSILGSLTEANEKLIEVGLADKVFRDGMTVEELEEYFNLVTNKETFAPLFETETGDQSIP